MKTWFMKNKKAKSGFVQFEAWKSEKDTIPRVSHQHSLNSHSRTVGEKKQ